MPAITALPIAAEPDLPDRPRQPPDEHHERDERRGRREEPQDVLTRRVAARPRERMRAEVAVLVEAGQVQRRHTRPPEQPRCHRTTRALRRLAWHALPMRVAVISDIHSNLPALEAVLADVDRRGTRRALVPRRRRRLRAAAERMRRPRRASGPTLSLVREPRPGGDRHDRHRRLQRRRRRRGPLDADVLGEPQAAWLRGARAVGRARRASSSSTAARATRSGTTCSASRWR